MKALATLIAVGMLATVSGSAVAFHPQIREQQRYYSDLDFQTQVGEFTEYCDGHYEWWGYLSEYSQFSYGEC